MGRAVPQQSPRQGHAALQTTKGAFQTNAPWLKRQHSAWVLCTRAGCVPAGPGTFPTPGLWKGAGFHQRCLHTQHTPHTLGTLISGSPWGYLGTGGAWAGTQSVIKAGRALVLLPATGPIRQPQPHQLSATATTHPARPHQAKAPFVWVWGKRGQANCKIKNSSNQQCSLLKTGQLWGASSRALPEQADLPCPRTACHQVSTSWAVDKVH